LSTHTHTLRATGNATEVAGRTKNKQAGSHKLEKRLEDTSLASS